MTNEKDTERRKDILAMAKCVNHARAGWEKYDLSDFALGDVSREGMLNVAIAAYLYDIGYRERRYSLCTLATSLKCPTEITPGRPATSLRAALIKAVRCRI